MQQAAESEFPDRDIIVPWPLVWAALILIVTAAAAFALYNRGATLIDVRASSGRSFDALASWFWLLFFNVLLCGRETCYAVAGIMLVRAFSARTKGWRRALKFFIGALPAEAVDDPNALLDAEILVAVLIADWLIGLAGLGLHRASGQSIFTPPAFRAITFWGSLAIIGYANRWPAWLVRALATVGVAAALLNCYVLSSIGIFPTNLLVTYALAAAALTCVAWFILALAMRHETIQRNFLLR